MAVMEISDEDILRIWSFREEDVRSWHQLTHNEEPLVVNPHILSQVIDEVLDAEWVGEFFSEIMERISMVSQARQERMDRALKLKEVEPAPEEWDVWQ